MGKFGGLLVAGTLLTGCGGGGNKSNNQPNHQNINEATLCSFQQVNKLLSENNATLEVKCEDPDGLGKKGTITIDGQVIEFTIPEGSTAYDSNFTINNLLEGTTIATLEVLAKDGKTKEEELHTFTTEVKTVAAPTPEAPAPTPDTTPNTFDITDLNNQALNTSVTTTSITVSGINTSTTVSTNVGTLVIAGTDTGLTNSTVSNGQTVAVKLTTSSNYSTPVNGTLTIGGVTDSFTVTTEVAPNTPPTFSNIPNKFSYDGGGQDFSEDFSGFLQNPNGGTFSATGLPDGMTINPTTGVVTGYFDADPTRSNWEGNSNVYNVTIKYTKNGTTYNSNTFVWDIDDEG